MIGSFLARPPGTRSAQTRTQALWPAAATATASVPAPRPLAVR